MTDGRICEDETTLLTLALWSAEIIYRNGNKFSINIPLLLGFYFCTNSKLAAMIQDIQCTVGLSCVAVVTENTHDRPCNVHGYFGLHYTFRHHPDSEVFRKLHQRFCEREELVNTGRPRTLWRQPMEMS